MRRAQLFVRLSDQKLQDCDGIHFQPDMITGPRRVLNEGDKACYTAFLGVKVSVNRGAGQSIINGYKVELMNLPYAYRAAMNTLNAQNGTPSKTQQNELELANQNKPKF